MPGSPTFFTANGNRVVTASLSIPLYGLWVADVLLPASDTLTNPVTLMCGNLTLQGAIYRQGYFGGSQYARLVGGYAGWRTTIPSQAYNNPAGLNLSLILGDAAGACGEQVNVITDSSVGTFYIRENAQAQRLLRQLGGPLWWVDNTGVTQVGPRPTMLISSPFLVETYDAGSNLFVISTEDYASWLPANTFQSVTMNAVGTVSLTRIDSDNDGKLRLQVLGSP
jgi:hypothetical protein